jgi:hypothetical protein
MHRLEGVELQDQGKYRTPCLLFLKANSSLRLTNIKKIIQSGHSSPGLDVNVVGELAVV